MRRNGALVEACTAGGTASPDPCVESVETLPDGDQRITIFTSQASEWDLSVPGRRPVPMDVKPADGVNEINLSSKEFPVAILSAPSFSAATVDRESIRFGRTGDEDSIRRHKTGRPVCGTEDADGDGLDDLVCHFTTSKTGLQVGDAEAVLRGKTTAGAPFEGRDQVIVITK